MEERPIEPIVKPNTYWKVNVAEALSPCDNRPGLKKIYVTVLDENGVGLGGIKVRFDVEPSRGIAYDHPNIWGPTDENGYLEWNHLGIPTRYMLWMENDEDPLIVNIRADLGYGYCNPSSWPPVGWIRGWIPINRPGVYSYRIVIQRKKHEDQ